MAPHYNLIELLQDERTANSLAEKTISDVAASSEQQSTPKVSQDYSKIPVDDGVYSGDDVRDLEPSGEKDDSDGGEESDEEDSGETDVKVPENISESSVVCEKVSPKNSKMSRQNKNINRNSSLASSTNLGNSRSLSLEQLSKKRTPLTKAEKKRKRKLNKRNKSGGYVEDDIGTKVGDSGHASTGLYFSILPEYHIMRKREMYDVSKHGHLNLYKMVMQLKAMHHRLPWVSYQVPHSGYCQ